MCITYNMEIEICFVWLKIDMANENSWCFVENTGLHNKFSCYEAEAEAIGLSYVFSITFK